MGSTLCAGQVQLGIQRRDPPLKCDATWTGDGEEVGVQRRRCRIAGHRAGQAMVCDELLELREQARSQEPAPLVEQAIRSRDAHRDSAGRIAPFCSKRNDGV